MSDPSSADITANTASASRTPHRLARLREHPETRSELARGPGALEQPRGSRGRVQDAFGRPGRSPRLDLHPLSPPMT